MSRSIVAASIAIARPPLARASPPYRPGSHASLIAVNSATIWHSPPGTVNAPPPNDANALARIFPRFGRRPGPLGRGGLDEVARLVLAEEPGMAAAGGSGRARRPCRRPSPSRRSRPAARHRRRRGRRRHRRRRSGRARNRRCGARRRDRPAAARLPRGPRSRADRARRRDGPRSRRSRISASPARFSARSTALRRVGDQPDAADHRRRQDAAAVGLVVERDIARHDRVVEREAGLARCPRCSRRTGP